MAALTALQGLTAERLTAMTSIPIEETRKVMSAVHRRRHEFAPPGPIDGVRRVSLQALTQSCHLPSLRVKHTAASAVDPFEKYVFETHDNEVVEAVRIPLEKEGRFTVCVSSQVGCAMGCTFCATGRLGLRRNLETWEIVEQVRTVRLKMLDNGVKGRVHGVVFQGMGEPLANTDNVLAAIAVLSDPAGSQIHQGNVTVSTSGLPVGIRRMAREAPKVRLALSIGSARPEVRRVIMPVEKAHPLLGDVLDAVVEHAKLTGMQPLWAVTPLRGQNDHIEDAAALADLAKRFEALTDGIRPRISVIPYNSVGPGDPYERVELAEETAFRSAMRDKGVFTHKRGGGDVAAACGQLAGTISEGKVPEEAGAGGADGNTVTDTCEWKKKKKTEEEKDSELVARARRGHCVFFAEEGDDEERMDTSRGGGSGGGGCIFAQALGAPPVKLPARFERQLQEQQLAEQAKELLLRRRSSISTPAAVAVMAAAASAAAAPGAVVESAEDAAPLKRAGAGGEGKTTMSSKTKKRVMLPAGDEASARDSAIKLERSFLKPRTRFDDSVADDENAMVSATVEPQPQKEEPEYPEEEEEVDDDLKDAEDLRAKRQAEFQRVRRFTQVLKLVNQLRFRCMLVVLNTRTRKLLVLLAVSYLACFVAMQILLAGISPRFDRVVHAGDLLKHSQRGGTFALTLSALQQTPPVNISGSVSSLNANLIERATALDETIHGILLGFDGSLTFPSLALTEALMAPRRTEVIWSNGTSGRWPAEGATITRATSLWSLVRSYNSNMRVVGGIGSVDVKTLELYETDTNIERQRRYLFDNGPGILFSGLTEVLKLEKSDAKGYMETVIIAQEATAAALGLTFLLASVVFLRLLDSVGEARMQLFGAFLLVPRPVVLKMAARSTRLQEEEDGDHAEDDDDDDAEWAQRQVLETMAAGAAAGGEIVEEGEHTDRPSSPSGTRQLLRTLTNAGERHAAQALLRLGSHNQVAPIGASTDGTLRIKAKVRALGPRGSSSYLFLIPLIVWGVAAVTCYAISSVELDQINSVLGDIVFASIQAAISSRIRYFSTQILVAAAAVATAGGPGSASASGAEAALAQARADLAAEAAGMLKIHSGLIYGDEENDLHGSLYISTERQELLFGQNLCMRTQTPCRPTSDPYYAPTNNGLNALVKAVIDDAILLSADPISSLTVDNERFKFLMDVCPTDLFDGLATSVLMYEAESILPAESAQQVQLAALPLLLLGEVLFLIKFYKPWVRRIMQEMKRVSELLAQLPKELNVESLVLDALSEGADRKVAAAVAAAAAKRKKKEIPRVAAQATPPKLTVPLAPTRAAPARAGVSAAGPRRGASVGGA